jgi:hypothetical protein
MPKSAFIKLVDGSKQKEITLEQVKELLLYYQDMTQKTGEQLNWDYQNAAFPYEMEEKEQEGIRYLFLKGKDPDLYKYLIIGVSQEEKSNIPYVQIVLPDQATHGDLAKGNEYARFLAKQLHGELHLFNGRIQYFQTRK